MRYPLLPRCWLPSGCRDFSGLHNFFEVAQVFAYLLVRLLTKEFGDESADTSSRWVIFENNFHLGAAIAGAGVKWTEPALPICESPTERHAIN